MAQRTGELSRAMTNLLPRGTASRSGDAWGHSLRRSPAGLGRSGRLWMSRCAGRGFGLAQAEEAGSAPARAGDLPRDLGQARPDLVLVAEPTLNHDNLVRHTRPEANQLGAGLERHDPLA